LAGGGELFFASTIAAAGFLLLGIDMLETKIIIWNIIAQPILLAIVYLFV